MRGCELENTLFLGNGFSRTIFPDIPSWGTLYDGTKNKIKNYTFLYEEFRQRRENRDRKEEIIKKELVKKIEKTISYGHINENVQNLNKFGKYLFENKIHNIITTNYDNAIEFILHNYCEYEQDTDINITPERVYSIRTFKSFTNANTGHKLKLWKIHGDLDRIQSIMLGFDHYCGSIWKLNDYIKGSYTSSKNKKATNCSVSMLEKCKNQNFDGISWAELFFNSNLYIVGFGMALSEIDIWWLLNKRARFKLEITEIENNILYLYDPKYENADMNGEVHELLRAFDVSISKINSNGLYLEEIMSHMHSKQQELASQLY